MPEMTKSDEIYGSPEITDITERLVIAPRSGRFVPLPPETFTTEGEWAFEGQTLAQIRAGNELIPVVSLFSGWVMGMLAMEGQPVEIGAPLFRIRP
jgi:biotin carboxyl carrier protein